MPPAQLAHPTKPHATTLRPWRRMNCNQKWGCATANNQSIKVTLPRVSQPIIQPGEAEIDIAGVPSVPAKKISAVHLIKTPKLIPWNRSHTHQAAFGYANSAP